LTLSDKLNGKIKSNIIDIEFIDKLNGKGKIKSNIIDIFFNTII